MMGKSQPLIQASSELVQLVDSRLCLLPTVTLLDTPLAY